VQEYAEPIIDMIDPDESIFVHRLYRESCSLHYDGYVKDLGLLGRDLKQLIIIDNSPLCFNLQLSNAIPIPTWENDSKDRALLQLIPMLSQLSSLPDVRPHLAAKFRIQEGVLKGI
jgi:Dullard-like phosphatase family protein